MVRNIIKNHGQEPVDVNKILTRISQQSVTDFLKDLPSYNEKNFTLYNTEHGIRTAAKRPSVYLPTTETPSDQIIVVDKQHILLRFLHQQWEKKNGPKKREHTCDHPDGTQRKRPRHDRESL